MASMRLSLLWKKVASAMVKVADGRVRPVKDWTELEAPESERPDGEKDMPEPSEDDIADQSSESSHGADLSVEEMAERERSGIPMPEGAKGDQPTYVFHGQEEARGGSEGESVEESMLLDPQETARVLELFKRWDPEFLKKQHSPSGVPADAPREQKLAKKKKADIDALHADVVKRIDSEEGKKGKDPSKIKALYKELDSIISQMADFNKRYGPESQEEERLKNLENLSEGETAEERAQTAPYEFPGQMERTPEQAAADAANAQAEKDFEAAGGLAGQLLAKKDSSLSAEEKGNLGTVLQGFIKLLSKRELKGDAKSERSLVRKIISTLRALTNKFSDAIRSDKGLADQVGEVAYVVNGKVKAPGAGQSEGSAEASWHGNDPLRISIISRLERAAGGKSHSLRDMLVGKKPENITHSRGLPPADISTGTSTFSPRTAFQGLIMGGPAKEVFDAAVGEVINAAMAGQDIDESAVFTAAADKSYEMVKDEYAALFSETRSKYPGTLTKEHYAYDPENPPTAESPDAGAYTQPLDVDVKEAFVREYAELANEVSYHLAKRLSMSGEHDVEEAVPSEAYSESEEAARAKEWLEKDTKNIESPTKSRVESGPLKREMLYDANGQLNDVKIMFTDLPVDKHGDLHVLLQDELEAAKNANKEELVEQLTDSLAQLDTMMEGAAEISDLAADKFSDESLSEMGIGELLGLMESLPVSAHLFGLDMPADKAKKTKDVWDDAEVEELRIGSSLFYRILFQLRSKSKQKPAVDKSDIPVIQGIIDSMDKHWGEHSDAVEKATEEISTAKTEEEKQRARLRAQSESMYQQMYTDLWDVLSKLKMPGVKNE